MASLESKHPVDGDTTPQGIVEVFAVHADDPFPAPEGEEAFLREADRS